MSSTSDLSADSHRKRQWRRFSLRTLLIFVTLFCLLVGWFAIKLRQAERQRVAVANLRALGFVIRYEWEMDPDFVVDDRAQPPGPQWLRNWLGDDFLDTVVSVSVAHKRHVGDDQFQSVFSFPRLRHLALGESGITGASIARLPELNELESLDVSDDRINDTWMAGICDCRHLKKLVVADSHLITRAGLAHLSALLNLEDLVWLSADDAVMQSIAELKHLKKLVITSPKVTDVGMKVVAGFKELEVICLNTAAITNAGMQSLSKLGQLRHVRLTGTAIGDPGLQKLAQQQHIVSLELGYTKVSDSGLRSLGNWSALEGLSLLNTNVGDEGLNSIAGLKKLRNLDLSSTKITDEGLKSIAQLHGLELLGLSDTRVTDAGLSNLQSLKRLEILDLSKTAVTPEGVKRLHHSLPTTTIVYGTGSRQEPN
jgi:internalin A